MLSDPGFVPPPDGKRMSFERWHEQHCVRRAAEKAAGKAIVSLCYGPGRYYWYINEGWYDRFNGSLKALMMVVWASRTCQEVWNLGKRNAEEGWAWHPILGAYWPVGAALPTPTPDALANIAGYVQHIERVVRFKPQKPLQAAHVVAAGATDDLIFDEAEEFDPEF